MKDKSWKINHTRTEPGALYIHAEHKGHPVADIVICSDDEIIILNGKTATKETMCQKADIDNKVKQEVANMQEFINKKFSSPTDRAIASGMLPDFKRQIRKAFEREGF